MRDHRLRTTGGRPFPRGSPFIPYSALQRALLLGGAITAPTSPRPSCASGRPLGNGMDWRTFFPRSEERDQDGRQGTEAEEGYGIARTFPIARASAARRDASRETARARKQARETVRDQAAVGEGH